MARDEPQALPDLLDDRDPDYIRDTLPAAWLLATLWHRAEVRGLDSISFTLAFSSYFGVERRFHQLAHKLVMAMPGIGTFLRKYGTIEASHANAEVALNAGAAVLV